MENRFAVRTTASLLALLLGLSGAALANDSVAKIENAGEWLEFHAVVEADTWVLTVSGPCNYLYKAKSTRGRLMFRLGEETADGRYIFSVEATRKVDPKVMEILREARATGDNTMVGRLCRDGRLPDPTLTQTGTFTVVDRKIVFDSFPESRRKSDRDGRDAAAALSPETPATLQAASDPIPAATLTASCDWARMEPGAGVAER